MPLQSEIDGGRQAPAPDAGTPGVIDAQGGPVFPLPEPTLGERWKNFYDSFEENRQRGAATVTKDPYAYGTGMYPAPSSAEDFRAMGAGAVRAGLPTAASMTGAAAPYLVPPASALGEYLGSKIEGSDPTAGRVMGAGVASLLFPGEGQVSNLWREGTKQGAMAALGKGVETRIDENRSMSLPEFFAAFGQGAGAGVLHTKLADARRMAPLTDMEVLRQTQKDALLNLQKYGIKAPPSEFGEGSDLVSSLAGGAAERYAVIGDNQLGFQQANREDLPGLQGGPRAPIMPDQLQAYRDKLGEPYEELGQLAGDARTKLAALKAAGPPKEGIGGPGQAARDEYDKSIEKLSNILIEQGNANVTELPVARRAALKTLMDLKAQKQGVTYADYADAKAVVDKMENQQIAAAHALGRPDLATAIETNRPLIAKSYETQSATDPFTGQVDIKHYGNLARAAQDAGLRSHLTGNMAKMAAFQSNFPRLGRTLAGTPAQGVNAMTVNQATGTIAEPGIISKVLGAAQSKAGAVARWAQLRPSAQAGYVTPRMENPNSFNNFLAALSRHSALAAQRQAVGPLSQEELDRLEELQARQEEQDQAQQEQP